MQTITLTLTMNQALVDFIAGALFGLAHSPNRDTRKWAIESFGEVYPHLSEAGRKDLDEAGSYFQELVDDPELMEGLTADVVAFFEKFKNRFNSPLNDNEV